MMRRYAIPDAESLRGPIADDEFDAQIAKSEEEKVLAVNARASKLWRMLRICYKDKFSVFDKIDDGNDLQALFGLPNEGAESQHAAEGEIGNQEGQHLPKSPDVPVIIATESPLVVETSVK